MSPIPTPARGDTLLQALEAVRLADLENKRPAQITTRLALVDAALSAARPSVAFTAFKELRELRRSQEAQSSNRFFPEEHEFIVRLARFAEVSREHLEGLVDDAETWLAGERSAARAAARLRFTTTWRFGDLARAERLFEAWLGESPAPDDCQACDLDTRVRWLCARERFEEAIQVAKPLLTGTQRCANAPATTYGLLELAAFLSGDLSRAVALVPKARSMLRNERAIETVHEHVMFLALTKNFGPALFAFEKRASEAARFPDEVSRFNFNRAALLLFRLLYADGARHLRLKLGEDHPLSKVGRQYELSELLSHFERLTQVDGDALDRRNHTLYFRTAYDQLDALASRAHLVQLTHHRR